MSLVAFIENLDQFCEFILEVCERPMWYKLVLLFVEKFRQTVQPVFDFEDEKMNNKIDLGCCIIVFWFYCAVVVSKLRNEILVFSLPHQLEKLLIFAQLLQLVIFIFLEVNRMNIS